MASIVITGYLPKEVIDNDHKSAKVALRYLRELVKKAGGKAERAEVLRGEIFLTLKEAMGLEELKKELEAIKEVVVEEPSEAALIFRKEKARAEAASVIKT